MSSPGWLAGIYTGSIAGRWCATSFAPARSIHVWPLKAGSPMRCCNIFPKLRIHRSPAVSSMPTRLGHTSCRSSGFPRVVRTPWGCYAGAFVNSTCDVMRPGLGNIARPGATVWRIRLGPWVRLCSTRSRRDMANCCCRLGWRAKSYSPSMVGNSSASPRPARLEPYIAGRMLTSEVGNAWFTAAASVLAELPDLTAAEWCDRTERFLGAKSRTGDGVHLHHRALVRDPALCPEKTWLSRWCHAPGSAGADWRLCQVGGYD
jgi:hypothetical protein